jgi:hypothetical protein
VSLSGRLGFASCALALCSATTARAAEGSNAADGRTGPSAAVLAGYGHEFVQGIQGLDVGFGMASGYTFAPEHLYLGGTFVWHLGSSERARASTYRYENLRNEYALSADAGWDFFLGQRWVLRPMLIGGFLVDGATTTIGADSLSSSNAYGFLGPAIALLVRIDRVTAGVSLRVPVLPSAFVSHLMVTGYLSLGAYF